MPSEATNEATHGLRRPSLTRAAGALIQFRVSPCEETMRRRISKNSLGLKWQSWQDILGSYPAEQDSQYLMRIPQSIFRCAYGQHSLIIAGIIGCAVVAFFLWANRRTRINHASFGKKEVESALENLLSKNSCCHDEFDLFLCGQSATNIWNQPDSVA